MADDRLDVPAGLWNRCDSCGHMVYEKEVADALYVCPECGHHRRIDARTRMQQLVDTDSFEEHSKDLRSTDPLKFTDRMPYKDRLDRERKKTGEQEAVIVGMAYIRGRRVSLAVMNPHFIMASMGAVVGEKITRAIEKAVDEDIPLVIVTASGGQAPPGYANTGATSPTARCRSRRPAVISARISSGETRSSSGCDRVCPPSVTPSPCSIRSSSHPSTLDPP